MEKLLRSSSKPQKFSLANLFLYMVHSNKLAICIKYCQNLQCNNFVCFKYFKREPKKPPDPSGPLSTHVPLESMFLALAPHCQKICAHCIILPQYALHEQESGCTRIAHNLRSYIDQSLVLLKKFLNYLWLLIFSCIYYYSTHLTFGLWLQ